MTQRNGYRISTAIFALLFAAMVVREFTRPEAVPARPGSAPAAGGSRTDEDHPPTPAEGKAPAGETPDPLAERTPPDSTEPSLDLAMRVLILGFRRTVNWSRELPKLEPRREEIVPILEDWLRRREELFREEIPLLNVPRAYAELAGARALPLLETLLGDPRGRWAHAVNEALTRIDDPGAAALLRRYQESLPENHSGVSSGALWGGSPAARGLLKDWARNPPANAPKIGEVCRLNWFRGGTAEDREESWKLMSDLERLRALSGYHARSWNGPWPARFAEAAAAGLRSRDPWSRHRAAFNVVSAADILSADLLREAEVVLAAEIEAAEGRSRSEGPTLSSLVSVRRSLQNWREEREAEQRRRELLSPR